VFSYLVKENPQLFIRHCKEKLNWWENKVFNRKNPWRGLQGFLLW
jgi:hypothetical protein